MEAQGPKGEPGQVQRGASADAELVALSLVGYTLNLEKQERVGTLRELLAPLLVVGLPRRSSPGRSRASRLLFLLAVFLRLAWSGGEKGPGRIS